MQLSGLDYLFKILNSWDMCEVKSAQPLSPCSYSAYVDSLFFFHAPF